MSTREELTLQAEKCLRLGRVDDAIAHYRDLAHLEPVEWGVVKQLADLLERAGQREGAARQFARWADHLFAEGFHAKAAALYKKVLKLDDADEHALWQLGEVSIALKLRGDARVAFQRVVDLRQRRGDEAGAAIARQRRDALEAVSFGPAHAADVATRVCLAKTAAPCGAGGRRARGACRGAAGDRALADRAVACGRARGRFRQRRGDGSDFVDGARCSGFMGRPEPRRRARRRLAVVRRARLGRRAEGAGRRRRPRGTRTVDRGDRAGRARQSRQDI